MVRPPIHTPKLRYLGVLLRELRNRQKLTQRELATVAGMSDSALSRLELGQQSLRNINLARLLIAAGANDDERERIMEVATEADQQNWLATGDIPEQLLTLAAYEEDAIRIISVSLGLIPGLLQTPEYTQAILEEAELPAREVEAQLAFRLRRQAVFNRDIELVAIIDEPVLARPIGGRAVMANQLRHIVTLATQGKVAIQVIPYENTMFLTRSGGSYHLLEFKDLPPVAHPDHKLGGLLSEEILVQDLIGRTNRLRQFIHSPTDSVELIREVLRTLESA